MLDKALTPYHSKDWEILKTAARLVITPWIGRCSIAGDLMCRLWIDADAASSGRYSCRWVCFHQPKIRTFNLLGEGEGENAQKQERLRERSAVAAVISV